MNFVWQGWQGLVGRCGVGQCKAWQGLSQRSGDFGRRADRCLPRRGGARVGRARRCMARLAFEVQRRKPLHRSRWGIPWLGRLWRCEAWLAFKGQEAILGPIKAGPGLVWNGAVMRGYVRHGAACLAGASTPVGVPNMVSHGEIWSGGMWPGYVGRGRHLQQIIDGRPPYGGLFIWRSAWPQSSSATTASLLRMLKRCSSKRVGVKTPPGPWKARVRRLTYASSANPPSSRSFARTGRRFHKRRRKSSKDGLKHERPHQEAQAKRFRPDQQRQDGRRSPRREMQNAHLQALRDGKRVSRVSVLREEVTP